MRNAIVIRCEIPELNTTHVHLAVYEDHICIHYGTIFFDYENHVEPMLTFKTTLKNERLSPVAELSDFSNLQQIVAYLQQRPQRTLANLAKNLELLSNEKQLPATRKDELLIMLERMRALRKVSSL